jgi:AcrR family transcriptional regulator
MSDVKEKPSPTSPVIPFDTAGKPKGKRELTKLNNREAILNSAREVFAELGYGATTVRDVIRKTGLASGTFYNYFKSKEEVFEAIMDDGMRRIRPRLKEFIRNAYETYFDYLVSDRHMFQMIRGNQTWFRVRMDTPEILAGLEEIKEYIEEDIRDGNLPGVDSEYLMAAVVGIATEIGDRMVLRETLDPKGAAAFATTLVLQGFKALPLKASGNT